MEQEKILESNKLIAKFMGQVTSNSAECIVTDKRLVSELKYNSSWDWLMPVVEKICKIVIHVNPDGSKVTSCLRTFGMIADDGDYMVRFNGHFLFKDKDCIIATYNAVIDFIQSHNDIYSEK